MSKLNYNVPKELDEQIEAIIGNWCLVEYRHGDGNPIGFEIAKWINQEEGAVNSVSYFVLSPLPGCCGAVVSNKADVRKEFRKKGLGTLANKLRIHLAKELGYSSVLATTISSNVASNKILLKNGWIKLNEFINRKTGNTVNVYSVNT